MLRVDKVFAQRRFDLDGYDIGMKDGAMVVSAGVFMLTMPTPGECIQPALQLDAQSAQLLLQALWDAGLRPNSGESSMAHVDALKSHLNDMRTIAMAYAMPPVPAAPSPDRPTGSSADY